MLIPIEKFQRGDLFEEKEPLPLHCTLMHWFSLEDEDFSERKVRGMLEIICARFGKESIELYSQERALFGPNDDVPVSVLARNQDLNFLHTSLLIELAKEHAKLKELRWVGAGYRAHATDVEGRSFPVGASHKSTHLVLMSRGEDKARRVWGQFHLGVWAF